MSFIKRDVKDRVVQYPRRYQLVEVQPGIFDLIPVTGTVTEEGTPVNKELLQRYEDGLENALEKTGDGKDVIVTFTEAATEAHIASGEKLSTLFGKILKMFKGKAPNSHASSATTYGVGTTANYGHCKTINGLTQSSHVNGNALSAYQGKVLKDLIGNTIIAGAYTGDDSETRTINLGFRPKAVIVLVDGKYIVTSSNTRGGLAIDGYPVLGYKRNDAQHEVITIADTGFTLSAGDYYDEVNKAGRVYHYVAFR
jgi:hypothetical protein